MATALIGHHKKTVDDVAHGKRRELQAVRAEWQACKRQTEVVCREMLRDRAELDAALREYDRRKEELANRQTAAHDRLALALESRSAAELSRETVRDRAENDLKAQRTAGTVRAYRLDTRWRRLHGQYRGFVAEVLSGDEPSAGHSRQLCPPTADDEGTTAASRRQPPKIGGRRFFAVADKFSVQHRRESLRTSRSLLAIMSGYLRETSDDGDGNSACSKGITPPLGSSRRRRSLRGTAVLDGVKPEQVLDKLRVIQEQCGRIAERVRRRTVRCSDAKTDDAVRNDNDESGVGSSCSSANDGLKLDVLAEARQRLAAGLEYLQTIRALKDKAVSAVRRERVALRALLCAACNVVCPAGNKLTARPSESSCTVVEIAARLERACFALFARLDKAAKAGGSGSAGRDVVASCLRVVQARRADDIRRARDVARRVDDFHKATSRLLMATAAPTKRLGETGRSARCRPPVVVHSKRSMAASRSKGLQSPTRRVLASARRTPPSGKIPTVPSSSAVSPPAKGVDGQSAATADRDVMTITMLCPPTIGIIEYE